MFRSQFTICIILIVSVITYYRPCSAKSVGCNNVCTTFEDYNDIRNSPNCYYDPDVDVDDAETLIRNNIGKVETYKQVTKDGYILTAYRAPRENPKGVVLLAHPLTVDAIVFISTGNLSLAFMLWNEGYDVWMPSNRGTVLSPDHVTLDSTDYAYSNFSFHEIAVIDMQLWIEFVAKKTKRNDIVFFGHSMSSTTGLVYSALLPEEAKKYVKVFILSAPGFRFKHVSIITVRALLQIEPILPHIAEAITLGGIYQSPLLWPLQALVRRWPFNRFFTIQAALYGGWTPFEFDPRTIAQLLYRIPRGMSIKEMHHYSQIYRSGVFRQYDYGKEGNKQQYGTAEPPAYPLADIQAPIYLICSAADAMTTLKDCDELYNELPERAKIYGRFNVHGLNHLDYHTGIHRIERFFIPLIEFINKLFSKDE